MSVNRGDNDGPSQAAIRKDHMPRPLRVTDPVLDRGIGEGLINEVITAAVMEQGPSPGIWQKMIQAAGRGAEGTQAGTVEAFLFQAMVDRLLEEFHALDSI